MQPPERKGPSYKTWSLSVTWGVSSIYSHTLSRNCELVVEGPVTGQTVTGLIPICKKVNPNAATRYGGYDARALRFFRGFIRKCDDFECICHGKLHKVINGCQNAKTRRFLMEIPSPINLKGFLAAILTVCNIQEAK